MPVMVRQALLTYMPSIILVYCVVMARFACGEAREGVHTNVGGMVALPVSASKNIMCSRPNNVAYVEARI